MSPTTGVVLNNQMDSFSTPGLRNSDGIAPSSPNFIKPGKRPMSSMSPTILLAENGDVRLALGASGSSRMITSISLVSFFFQCIVFMHFIFYYMFFFYCINSRGGSVSCEM